MASSVQPMKKNKAPLIARPEESQPAKFIWFDRKKYVTVNILVQRPKNVLLDIQKEKITLCCKNDDDDVIYNELNLYDKLMIGDCSTKVYDRCIRMLLRKHTPNVGWPRLQKDEARPSWIATDYDNWRDWTNEDDDGEEECKNYLDMIADMGNKNVGPKPSMDDFSDSD